MKYNEIKLKSYNELCDCMLKEHKNKVAIWYYENDVDIKITYNQLVQDISNIYFYLKNLNIKNKKIAILSENRYEYVVLNIAISFDNIVVPIDISYTNKNIKEIINKYNIDIVLYTNYSSVKIENLENVKKININELCEKASKENNDIQLFLIETKNVDNNKFSMLALTSGTEGLSKGVMLSEKSILHSVYSAINNNYLYGDMMNVLPLNHVFGYVQTAMVTLYNGETLCLCNKIENFFDDLEYFNPYCICAVPMMVRSIYNRLKCGNIIFSDTKYNNLKAIICGGAEIEDECIKEFNKYNIEILVGYGMTETAGFISSNILRDNEIGSVGIIGKEIDVKIAEDDEILVKTEGMMIGYYNDKNSNIDKNGYFHTGDIGCIKNNCLYVTGRKKNVAVLSNGKKFSKEIIEEEFKKLFYIKNAIIKIVKNNNVEMIILYVMLIENKYEDNLKEDIKIINDKMPTYMRVDDYLICDIDVNNMGKTIR